MANISDASGTITFSKEFVEKYPEAVKEWVKNAYTNGYGIVCLEEYAPGKTDYEIQGIGRWTFKSTLEDLGLCLKWKDGEPSLDPLHEPLRESGDYVDISFRDYESDCEVYYEANGSISVPPEMTEKGKYAVDLDCEGLEYTAANIIGHGDDEGYDLNNKEDEKAFKEDMEALGGEYEERIDELIQAIKEDTDRDGGVFTWEIEDQPEDLLDLLPEKEEEM